jgi:hypothetical protein
VCEGDEPREGAFRTLAPTRTARAILRLGDKRRRRLLQPLLNAIDTGEFLADENTAARRTGR